MKMKCLTYLLISAIVLGLSFVSCENDDNTNVKNLEGHWIYAGTKADVHVTDSALKRLVEDYIISRNEACKVSYEFKNDKTYYYYQDLAEPLKGIFRTVDKNYFVMDDVYGIKSMARNDSIIYVISDVREEIIRNLGIDEKVLVKALATDTFRRGLFLD
ncbi:MAG: hypothetical protein LBV43_12860 [Prevotella sp.]|jgi:copper chaperone CopZ|nr:hypothetical protein [Prevotella sp.]